MAKKGFRKAPLYTAAVLAVAILIPLGVVLKNKAGQSAKSGEDTVSVQLKGAKTRVSVHDPSIVKVDDTYYVFGSHIEAARSKDLKNWTKFTNAYTTPNNAIYGSLSKNLAGSFA